MSILMLPPWESPRSVMPSPSLHCKHQDFEICVQFKVLDSKALDPGN